MLDCISLAKQIPVQLIGILPGHPENERFYRFTTLVSAGNILERTVTIATQVEVRRQHLELFPDPLGGRQRHEPVYPLDLIPGRYRSLGKPDKKLDNCSLEIGAWSINRKKIACVLPFEKLPGCTFFYNPVLIEWYPFVFYEIQNWIRDDPSPPVETKIKFD